MIFRVFIITGILFGALQIQASDTTVGHRLALIAERLKILRSIQDIKLNDAEASLTEALLKPFPAAKSQIQVVVQDWYSVQNPNNHDHVDSVIHSTLADIQKVEKLDRLGLSSRILPLLRRLSRSSKTKNSPRQTKIVMKALHHANALQDLESLALSISQSQDPEALMNAAWAYGKLNKRALMQSLYHKVADLNTGKSGEAAFWLAFSYYEKGDYSKAHQWFLQAQMSQSTDIPKSTHWYLWWSKVLQDYQKDGEEMEFAGAPVRLSLKKPAGPLSKDPRTEYFYERFVSPPRASTTHIRGTKRASGVLDYYTLMRDARVGITHSDAIRTHAINNKSEDKNQNYPVFSPRNRHERILVDRWLKALLSPKELCQGKGSHMRTSVALRACLAIRRYKSSSPHMWPQPYIDLVDQYAKEYNVPINLVYAIMRQESFYDENAHSHVGARGLIQLMPYTATGIARELNIHLSSPDDLYDPKINLRLGIAFIGKLLRMFDEQPDMAIAAYNGGPEQVSKWANNYPVDIFVEMIPFKETREYVKKVTRNWAHYDGLMQGYDHAVLPYPFRSFHGDFAGELYEPYDWSEDTYKPLPMR